VTGAGSEDGGRSPGDGLRATAVSRAFKGVQALDGVTFELAPREVVGLIGPNGAGKTTLINLITGFDLPDSGTISLDSQDVTRWGPARRARNGLARTFQQGRLFGDLSVRENVELGGYILFDKALTARRLAAVIDVFPQIAGWAGQKAGSLSGGQQRLVEFARALMLEPRLLLLDEPSMGLAPKILRTVFDAIRQMNAAGTTILLVEQNARAGLRLSTHGVVMENGRVRLSGTGREVLENPEIGALYLGGAVSPD